MKKSTYNYNDKGQKHGYQEWYSPTSYKLMVRGHRKNNDWVKYVEWHNYKITIYYIK
jgi:hypothetical protein